MPGTYSSEKSSSSTSSLWGTVTVSSVSPPSLGSVAICEATTGEFMGIVGSSLLGASVIIEMGSSCIGSFSSPSSSSASSSWNEIWLGFSTSSVSSSSSSTSSSSSSSFSTDLLLEGNENEIFVILSTSLLLKSMARTSRLMVKNIPNPNWPILPDKKVI